MKELFQILSEMQKHLEQKKQALSNPLDSYTLGKLQNIENKILNFKKIIPEVTLDPTQKNVIITNFSKTKEEIIKDIDNLG